MGEGIFYPVVSKDDSFSGGGSVGVGYNYLRFGNAAGTVFGLWVRFPNITIPRGSTITEAYVRFVSYTDRNTVTCNVNAYFNNVDDAVAPTSSAQFDGLALTDGIAWDSVEAWINDSRYNTPELKTILQTIVNRANWISGNAAQFIIKDNGSSSNAQRFPSSIDYLSGTEKAELHVTWTDPPPPPTSIIDIKTYIEAVRSKWWLSTDIEAVRSKWWLKTEIQTVGTTSLTDLSSEIEAGSIALTDLIFEINAIHPTRKKFLLLRYDHVPKRDALNVKIGKAMQFRLYNPDPAFGIDLTTFKVRFNEGTWYRYGNSRLTFTEVSYREYLVYFNPPNFEYDSQVDVELYCEDNLNNPGIKLEIF